METYHITDRHGLLWNLIAKALNEARLEANVQLKGKGISKKKWPSPFAIASGLLLTASFLKYVYHPLRWLAVAAVAAGIFPILLKAISAIRHLRIDVNILAIIAGKVSFLGVRQN